MWNTSAGNLEDNGALSSKFWGKIILRFEFHACISQGPSRERETRGCVLLETEMSSSSHDAGKDWSFSSAQGKCLFYYYFDNFLSHKLSVLCFWKFLLDQYVNFRSWSMSLYFSLVVFSFLICLPFCVCWGNLSAKASAQSLAMAGQPLPSMSLWCQQLSFFHF